MILAGLVAGYVKLEANTAQNTKDVKAAVEMAERVDRSQRELDTARQAQINSLTVDVAVLKVTATSIDKKLDELIIQSRNNTTNAR